MVKRDTLRLMLLMMAVIFGTTYMGAQKRVLLFDINDEINSTAWVHTQQALLQAQEIGADQILIHMNTYGGEVVYADSIRSAILASRTPIYVFINDNAASAGALIATACDSIFMTPGASIGAASVVNGADGTKMPDKYQSYMRAKIRATAEAHPYHSDTDTARHYLRDPRIAEAFVDEMVAIPGVVDSAHILTLTAREALRLNYCEGIMNSTEEVVAHVAPEAKVTRYEPTALDNIKGSLMGTVLRGILILIIMGGIYFELQTPGLGFPSVAAVVAALLYFAPLYIDGVAANWEILLFLVGLVLLAVEIFVIPGVGVAGIVGVVCVLAGLSLSMVGNEGLSFEGVSTGELSGALWVVGISLLAAVVLCVLLGKKMYTAKSGIFSKLILDRSQEMNEGFVGVEKETVDALKGKSGEAITDLRPGGKVRIEGVVYDAISTGVFVERGTAVKVVSSSAGQVVVEKE